MKIDNYKKTRFIIINTFLSSVLFMYFMAFKNGDINLANIRNDILASNASNYGIGLSSLLIFLIPASFAGLVSANINHTKNIPKKILFGLLTGLFCILCIFCISYLSNNSELNHYTIFLFAMVSSTIVTFITINFFNHFRARKITLAIFKKRLEPVKHSKIKVLCCFTLSPFYLGSIILTLLLFFIDSQNWINENIVTIILLPWLSFISGTFGIIFFILPTISVSICYLITRHINDSIQDVMCGLAGTITCIIFFSLLLKFNNIDDGLPFYVTSGLTAFLISKMLNLLKHYEVLLSKSVIFIVYLLTVAIVPFIQIIYIQLRLLV